MHLEEDFAVGKIKATLMMNKTTLRNIECRISGTLGPIVRQIFLREVRAISAAYDLRIMEALEQEDNAACFALTGFRLKDSNAEVAATLKTSSPRQFEDYGMIYTVCFRAVAEDTRGNLVLGAIISADGVDEPFGWPKISHHLVTASNIVGRKRAQAFHEQFPVELFCFKAGLDTIDQAKPHALPRLSRSHPDEGSERQPEFAQDSNLSTDKTSPEPRKAVDSFYAPTGVSREQRRFSPATSRPAPWAQAGTIRK